MQLTFLDFSVCKRTVLWEYFQAIRYFILLYALLTKQELKTKTKITISDQVNRPIVYAMNVKHVKKLMKQNFYCPIIGGLHMMSSKS